MYVSGPFAISSDIFFQWGPVVLLSRSWRMQLFRSTVYTSQFERPETQLWHALLDQTNYTTPLDQYKQDAIKTTLNLLQQAFGKPVARFVRPLVLHLHAVDCETRKTRALGARRRGRS